MLLIIPPGILDSSWFIILSSRMNKNLNLANLVYHGFEFKFGFIIFPSSVQRIYHISFGFFMGILCLFIASSLMTSASSASSASSSASFASLIASLSLMPSLPFVISFLLTPSFFVICNLRLAKL